MIYLLAYTVAGFVLGCIGAGIASAITKRFGCLLFAALLVPLPFAAFVVLFGLSFMRETGVDAFRLAHLAGFIFLLVAPGSFFAALFVRQMSNDDRNE